jgi:hypothetical protein
MRIQAKQLLAFNKWATIVWILRIIPTVAWWTESVLWIGLMSIWANVVSHFTAWIAARAELENKSK